MFIRHVVSNWEVAVAEKKKVQNAIKSRIAGIEKKLERITDAYFEGIFESKAEYLQKKQKTNEELILENSKLAKSGDEPIDLEGIMLKIKEFMMSMGKVWKLMLRPENRHKFCSLIIPGGVFYDNESGFSNFFTGEIIRLFNEYSRLSDKIIDCTLKVTPRRITSNYWQNSAGNDELTQLFNTLNWTKFMEEIEYFREDRVRHKRVSRSGRPIIYRHGDEKKGDK